MIFIGFRNWDVALGERMRDARSGAAMSACNFLL
jgi:hypothetical protein